MTEPDDLLSRRVRLAADALALVIPPASLAAVIANVRILDVHAAVVMNDAQAAASGEHRS